MEITRGIQNTAQKVVVYGPEGIGKTTFASKFPDPLFIDTEGSTKKLDVKRLPTPTSFTLFMEEIAYVKANPNLCDTLVIDTADWTEKLCLEHICSTKSVSGIEDIGYGKGYTYLEEEFGRMLNRLSDLIDLSINVVITAHAAMRKFEQPDEMGAYDRWELKLQKKTAPLLKEWGDMVLFANYKTYVINVDNQGAAKGKNKAQGGARVMYTSHHPCWDAKNRHGLAPELPFEYSQIAAHIPAKTTGTDKVSAPTKEIVKTAPAEAISEEIKERYWHRAEQREVYASTTKEEEEAFTHSGEFVEISAAEYTRLSTEYNTAPPMPEVVPDPETDIAENLPKALTDLMKKENVTTAEVQRAVSSKGYYPEDTPISNYDPGFISGVLVAAWPQVFAIIKELREVEKQFGGN